MGGGGVAGGYRNNTRSHTQTETEMRETRLNEKERQNRRYKDKTIDRCENK